MAQTLVGVASSVSKEKKYDPDDTVEFASANGIGLVQAYMDKTLLNNFKRIHRLRESASLRAVQLTCHAPELLNEKILDKIILDSMRELLAFQPKKKMVIHFDQLQPLDAVLSVIEKINGSGLTVCIENFYQGKEEASFIGNCALFNALLTACRKTGLDIVPVVDLGRLFIADYVHTYDALLLTKLMLSTIAALGFSVVFHIIDFNDYSQSRESWCALGKGLMPYGKIFSFAQKINLSVDHCVLEYEKKEMCLESMKALLSLFTE